MIKKQIIKKQIMPTALLQTKGGVANGKEETVKKAVPIREDARNRTAERQRTAKSNFRNNLSKASRRYAANQRLSPYG